jgi:Tol biopolymer transport system component
VELTFVAPQGIAFTEGSRNVPTVAPDGASVAFLATDDTGGVQLWVRTLADSTPRLMQNTRGATRPFWSPDGRSLAYFAGDGLYRVEVSGADPRLLAKGTESRGGSWGRDGTLLLALEPQGSRDHAGGREWPPDP